MRVAVVPSERLFGGEQRLAPSFHVSADQEALDILTKFDRSDTLGALCLEDGLYRGPIFRRVFVSDASFGRPYVTATDLEQAEIRPIMHLSRMHGALLNRLTLKQDTIAVSCSGVNLGKAFYIRPDMNGLVASHDLIRVTVDSTKVRPGYLFAFLDSRFGRSALRKSAHGGSVRHIEPHDLVDLPVPRLQSAHEEAIHALVFEASRLLSNHVSWLEQATAVLETMSGLDTTLLERWEENPARLGWAERDADENSLRALNYDPRAQAIRSPLVSGRHSLLGDLCDPAFFRGKQVFKREEASAEEGVLLLGQRAAFRLRPEGRYIARRSVDENGLRVPVGTILIPSHGTLGQRELYCRAVAVTLGMSNYAFSGDFFRCVPLPTRIAPGYLYAFLRSRYAFRLLRSISSGGKQQELAPQRMAILPVPRSSEPTEREIACEVDRALGAYDEAVERLTQARQEIETALREPSSQQ